MNSLNSDSFVNVPFPFRSRNQEFRSGSVVQKNCATYHHISLHITSVRYVSKSDDMLRYVAINVVSKSVCVEKVDQVAPNAATKRQFHHVE